MTQSTQPNSKSGTYLNTFFFLIPFNKSVYTSHRLCTVNISQIHFDLSILSLRLRLQTSKTEKW